MTHKPPREYSTRRSVLTLFSSTLSSQLVTLAALPILSRTYEVRDFGVYAIYVSATSLLVILATLRYEVAIVLPKRDREAAAIKRLTHRILVLATSLIGLMSVILVAYLRPNLEIATYILLSSVGVLSLGSTTILTNWFIRAKSFRPIALARLIQAVFVAVSQIALGFILEDSGVGLVLGFIVGQIAMWGVLLIFDTSRIRNRDARSLRQWLYLLRRYWQFPAFMAPQALVDSLRLNGVNLLIGRVSLSELGQFTQAWRVVSLPMALLGSALAQVFFGEFSRTPRYQLYDQIKRNVILSLSLGLLPFTLLFFLSPLVVPLVLGGAWETAGLYAQALVPWLFLNLVTSPISTVFAVVERQRVGLLFSVVYTFTPLTVIVLFEENVYHAVIAMSCAQSLLLIVNIFLALWVTRKLRQR